MQALRLPTRGGNSRALVLTHTPAHVQLESKPGERYTDTQGLHVGFWAAWVLGEPCWSDGNVIPPQSYSAQGLLSMFFLSLSF